MIDGMALVCLTERALEILMPIIGHRMKFIQLLEDRKSRKLNEANITEADVIGTPVLEDVEVIIEGEPDDKSMSGILPLDEECDIEDHNQSG